MMMSSRLSIRFLALSALFIGLCAATCPNNGLQHDSSGTCLQRGTISPWTINSGDYNDLNGDKKNMKVTFALNTQSIPKLEGYRATYDRFTSPKFTFSFFMSGSFPTLYWQVWEDGETFFHGERVSTNTDGAVTYNSKGSGKWNVVWVNWGNSPISVNALQVAGTLECSGGFSSTGSAPFACVGMPAYVAPPPVVPPVAAPVAPPAAPPVAPPAGPPTAAPTAAPTAGPAGGPAATPTTGPAGGPSASPSATAPTAAPTTQPPALVLPPTTPYAPLQPAQPLAPDTPIAPVQPTAPNAAATEQGVTGNKAVLAVTLNAVGGVVVTLAAVQNDPNIRRMICEDVLTAAGITTGWTKGNTQSVFEKCTIKAVTQAAAKFAVQAVTVQTELNTDSPQQAQDAIRAVKAAAADGQLGTTSVSSVTGVPANTPTQPAVAAPTAPAVPVAPTAPTAPTAAPTVSGATATVDVTVVASAASVDAAARTTFANTVTQVMNLPQGQNLVTVTGVSSTVVGQKFATAADGAVIGLRIVDPSSATAAQVFNKFDAAVKANSNNIGQYRVVATRQTGTASPAAAAWCQPAFFALVALVAAAAAVMTF